MICGITAKLGLKMLILTMPFYFGWNARLRINAWPFHVKTYRGNIMSVFRIHEITRNPL